MTQLAKDEKIEGHIPVLTRSLKDVQPPSASKVYKYQPKASGLGALVQQQRKRRREAYIGGKTSGVDFDANDVSTRGDKLTKFITPEKVLRQSEKSSPPKQLK